jgi:hypothetical protein
MPKKDFTQVAFAVVQQATMEKGKYEPKPNAPKKTSPNPVRIPATKREKRADRS